MSSQASNPPLRYCNVTFVQEGRIEADGTQLKLLRCSRCQGSFYRGKEEQRNHWKVHKKVCVAPSIDEDNRVSTMSMDEAGRELMQLLMDRNYRAGSVWVLLLKRIRHLFLMSNDRSDLFNEDITSNPSTGRGMILSCARQLAFASNSNMELLWAIPNFSNFLLSVDFISDHMLTKKQQRVELSSEELSSYEYNSEAHVDPGYANLFGLFLMTGILSRSQGVIGLSSYSYRKTEYAKAAFRRMVQLWTDPYVRASLLLQKDQMTACRQEWLPLTMMNVIDQSPIDPFEIAPGLTVKDVVKTVVEESYIYTNLRLKEMVDCILESYGFEQEAWESFSAKERAECALLVVEKLIRMDSPKENKELCMRAACNIGAELIVALTGCDTRGSMVKNASLRLEVLRLASTGRTPKAERSFTHRMSPADYFGISLDKIVEMTMPQLYSLLEALKSQVGETFPDIPNDLLSSIAEFAAEPFSEESRGVELQYLSNIW